MQLAMTKRLLHEKTRLVVAALMVLLVALGYLTYMWLQKDVTIFIDEQVTQVKTFKSTVEEVLEEAGIELYAQDVIKPALEQKITEDQVIEITRAINVVVEVDGKKLYVDSIPSQVSDVLALAKVELGEKDIVEPSLGEKVEKGTVVMVSRITEELITEKQKVAYQAERKEDKTLERGIRKILQRGKNGIKENTIKVTYQDGKEINREIVSTKTLVKPVNQVVAYGVMQVASRGGQRIDFQKALEVTATAYTHTGNRTRTGTYPKVGTIAVDPKVIPLGSKLYVEGYGFAKAEDTGGAIKGNKIDVFLETKNEALRWGRKKVKVYVLK